ncbi:MAG: shikimate dehydrogenase [Polyangiaceae bacterium]
MRFAVLGSPIAHSKSPAMHQAAFRALGLAHTYEAIDCDVAQFEEHVRSLKHGKFQGFNVTVPHKLRALPFADEIDASAKHVGAANTLVREESGKVIAHNTDVGALVVELETLAGSRDRFRGRTAVVVGTGGAARAAIAACGHLGLRRVVILARAPDSLARDAEHILRDSSSHPSGLATTSIVARALERGPFANDDVGVVVQATTCGMTGGPDGSIVANAIDWAALPKSAVALDAVYAPRETEFVRAARAAGLACANGLGMLARQGALAFELWLKIPAPFDVMRAAIDG